jgi:hypothetical protein
MLYSSLVYNLLGSGFWNITAALPVGSVGTRLPVGVAETIPEKIFISRQLVAGDGFPTAEMTHLNGFIQLASQFHANFGLAPITINSFEDILNHYQALTAPIDRIRLVSHGNDEFLFLPVFNGGLWSFGMHTGYLQALQDSDEDGLRYVIFNVIGDPPHSPTLMNGTNQIVRGIRDLNSAVLAPFGLQTSGSPTGDLLKFFDVVNDFYQVLNGTIIVSNALLTAQQRTTLNTSLGLIETAIRGRLVGTSIGGTTITGAHLDSLKAAVMGATPIDLGFMGPVQNLNASVAADIQTALTASPRVEADIRSAFGRSGQPIFFNNVTNMVDGLSHFNRPALNMGGSTQDSASITGNSDLNAFAVVGSDLNFLRNGGRITINGVAATPAERTTLRDGLVALSDIIKARITASGSITGAQLNTFLGAMENLALNRCGITGGWLEIIPTTFTELTAANQAMQNHFRNNLNHFRGLMQAGDASHIDIRGCLVGKTPAFLVLLRDFWGTAANKPTVNAPEWFQIFGRNPSWQFATTVYSLIDTLASGGVAAAHVDPTDISTSQTRWETLIDFGAHYGFITALFTTGTQRDFATLAWRVWQTGGTGAGIPVLRMEAKRVDDLVSLSLGDIVERFRVIFEIASGSAPNTTMRGKLTSLQPLLVTYKTKSDAVAAGPAPGDLPGLFTDLTALAGSVAAITGATPASLAPASNSLADIQASVTNIGNNVDTFLTGALGAFFTAVQVRIGEGNARLRYFYSIGLPLVLQSASHPSSFVLTIFASGVNAAERNGIIAAALKSWMRIQWEGTPAQMAAMNIVINAMPITTDAQRNQAALWEIVAQDDPSITPTTGGAISPTQDFRNHLVTRP